MVGARVVRSPSSLLAELTSDGQPTASNAAETETSTPPADPASEATRFDTALSAAVGAALVTQRLTAKGLDKTVAVNRRLWNTTAPLRKPLEWVGVTEVARNAARSVAEQVDELEQTGRAEMAESKYQALSTLTTTIDSVVAYLGESPAVMALVRDIVQQLLPELADDPAIKDLVEKQVDALLPELADDMAIQNLIRKQAGAYLFYLQNHSEQVEALIRKQGDTYIEYLNQHPESVQVLIQGQSLGLAGQVMDGVRERAVTADFGGRDDRSSGAAPYAARRLAGTVL